MRRFFASCARLCLDSTVFAGKKQEIRLGYDMDELKIAI